MPHLDDMIRTTPLSQQDIGTALLVTIRDCGERNLAKPGETPSVRWCLFFEETDSPLAMNKTNLVSAGKVLGSSNTDDWIGKKIVLYVDPNVEYGGRKVGGIRLRAPKPGAVVAKNATASSAHKPLPPVERERPKPSAAGDVAFEEEPPF